MKMSSNSFEDIFTEVHVQRRYMIHEDELILADNLQDALTSEPVQSVNVNTNSDKLAERPNLSRSQSRPQGFMAGVWLINSTQGSTRRDETRDAPQKSMIHAFLSPVV